MSLTFDNVEWIISDIEGTTTSICFVKDVLFPEARRQLVPFLIANRNNQTVIEALKGLWEAYLQDKEKGSSRLPEVDFSNLFSVGIFDDKNLGPFVKYYDWLMSLDRKLGPLKTIQGLIWKTGYGDGSIKGHVYPEVPSSFLLWSKSCKIAIYSSGSVQAQKLLFSASEYGDLTIYISDYFDTVNAGAKIDSKSYEIIAKKLSIAPEKALFLTDLHAEYEAAIAAGMRAVLVDRSIQQANGNRIGNFEHLLINP